MQNVLDSLIPALLADKNRKFIYVEQVSIYIHKYILCRYMHKELHIDVGKFC